MTRSLPPRLHRYAAPLTWTRVDYSDAPDSLIVEVAWSEPSRSARSRWTRATGLWSAPSGLNWIRPALTSSVQMCAGPSRAVA